MVFEDARAIARGRRHANALHQAIAEARNYDGSNIPTSRHLACRADARALRCVALWRRLTLHSTRSCPAHTTPIGCGGLPRTTAGLDRGRHPGPGARYSPTVPESTVLDSTAAAYASDGVLFARKCSSVVLRGSATPSAAATEIRRRHELAAGSDRRTTREELASVVWPARLFEEARCRRCGVRLFYAAKSNFDSGDRLQAANRPDRSLIPGAACAAFSRDLRFRLRSLRRVVTSSVSGDNERLYRYGLWALRRFLSTTSGSNFSGWRDRQ